MKVHILLNLPSAFTTEGMKILGVYKNKKAANKAAIEAKESRIQGYVFVDEYSVKE